MKQKKYTKYIKKSVISIILLAVFLYIGGQVKGISTGIYFDTKTIELLSQNINPITKQLMIFVSFLGSAKFYIPLYIIILIYFIKKKYFIDSFILINGVLGSAAINLLVKAYYLRIRPEKYFQVIETGYSFPSGHSMVSMSSYVILTYLLLRNSQTKVKKTYIWIITMLLVSLIGLSRIYLGVHWPTDVLGGFSLGLIWAYINILITEVCYKK